MSFHVLSEKTIILVYVFAALGWCLARGRFREACVLPSLGRNCVDSNAYSRVLREDIEVAVSAGSLTVEQADILVSLVENLVPTVFSVSRNFVCLSTGVQRLINQVYDSFGLCSLRLPLGNLGLYSLVTYGDATLNNCSVGGRIWVGGSFVVHGSLVGTALDRCVNESPVAQIEGDVRGESSSIMHGSVWVGGSADGSFIEEGCNGMSRIPVVPVVPELATAWSSLRVRLVQICALPRTGMLFRAEANLTGVSSRSELILRQRPGAPGAVILDVTVSDLSLASTIRSEVRGQPVILRMIGSRQSRSLRMQGTVLKGFNPRQDLLVACGITTLEVISTSIPIALMAPDSTVTLREPAGTTGALYAQSMEAKSWSAQLPSLSPMTCP